LKTASVVTDSAGVIKAESDYYPWGGELQFVNNDSNDYKFTGKKRDTETGLDYFGARYYFNGMGRFVTADWSAGPATVPYAHLDNPQTLNLYSYLDNNPINGIDADGHAISHAFDGMVAGLDAGPSAEDLKAEGGPTQTQAALTLAAMSSSAFGWQQNGSNGSSSTSTTGAKQTQGTPERLVEKSTTFRSLGGIIVTYQVVDTHGNAVTDVSVQEHVKDVVAINAHSEPNPDTVHDPNGKYVDQIGPKFGPQHKDSYVKTEQTFTAYKRNHAYELTTKINQYVLVQNWKVTASAVIVVP
jgi:RHS repeat-associated protein